MFWAIEDGDFFLVNEKKDLPFLSRNKRKAELMLRIASKGGFVSESARVVPIEILIVYGRKTRGVFKFFPRKKGKVST